MKRSQVWLWGHVVGAHDSVAGGGGSSRVSPGEACTRLGISNLVMVAAGGHPAPPFVPFARELSRLERIVWSVLSDETPARDDLESVLALARETPNLVGGIVDDLLRPGRVGVTEIDRIAERLHAAPGRLDLWGVVYDSELDRRAQSRLDACDVLTLWTASTAGLPRREDNLARLVALTPGKRRLLGVYLWDFAAGVPVPAPELERSFAIGARWVGNGDLEGVILLASSPCGMGLESESLSRAWIASLDPSP